MKERKKERKKERMKEGSEWEGGDSKRKRKISRNDGNNQIYYLLFMRGTSLYKRRKIYASLMFPPKIKTHSPDAKIYRHRLLHIFVLCVFIGQLDMFIRLSGKIFHSFSNLWSISHFTQSINQVIYTNQEETH